jgi:hypothetical protein
LVEFVEPELIAQVNAVRHTATEHHNDTSSKVEAFRTYAEVEVSLLVLRGRPAEYDLGTILPVESILKWR